ncbi:MAG: imelysin family protein, partial [Cellvibrionaceae bacterium]
MATDTVSMITSTRRWSIALLSIIILLAGCEKQSDQPAQDAEETAPSAPHIAPQALAQITTRTWQQGREITQTIEPALLALQRATQTLTADPSELNLTNARKQWHQAHQQLMRLQPFFTLGHINPGLFKQLEHAQWQLDAWPIEPGYIDYFDVYKHSGIVNDIALPVTADAIRQQHGFSSDSDVAIGMHAIAYLLWGEKQQRPASDFAAQAPSASEQKNGLGGADLPPRRRGALLNLLLSLILDDLR